MSQSPAVETKAGGAPSAAPTGGPGDYIGALISLVSRSEVRYQGFLAQIDPEAATIALEQVRSFGTEGRLAAQGRPAEEIGIQNNSYEFVTFRAADVKDLKIDDPRPNREQQQSQQPAFVDPAILGSSGPNNPYGGPPPPPHNYGPGSPWGGAPPPHAHPYPGAYGHPGPPMQGAPSPYGMHPPPPGAFGGPPPVVPQAATPAQQSSTAAPPPPKSPSKPIPTGPKAATQQQQQPQPPTGPSSSRATNGAYKPGPPPNAPKGPSNKSPATNQKSAAAAAAASTPAPATSTPADKVADDLSKLKVNDAEKSTAASTSTPAAATLSPPIKANLPARPQVPAPRGVPGAAGRTRAPPTSVFDNRNGSGPEVPSSDFDFESANARFAKEAAEGGGGVSSPPTNNNNATSPSALGAAAADAVLFDTIPPPNEEPKSFYDKSSFFDNISSEVRDRYDRTATSPTGERNAPRGGGPPRGGGRQARFEEDRKNLDTFGEVGNAYRGGRGRGRGRGGRGGFRGGPRGRGGRGRGGGVGGFGAGINV